jgi:archaemetzincin
LNRKNILLISHGHFEGTFLEKVAEEVNREYQFLVLVKECHSDLSEFYDPTRGQYDGNKLLKFVDSNSSSGTLKTIGLFRIDLFIPILTYIFGQAVFKGSTGIASIYRLRNEQYGIKRDDNLLLERFGKVVIHEVGHTFGLVHCYVPNCVMRSSTYVEDIDQKDNHLCAKCKMEIETEIELE